MTTESQLFQKVKRALEPSHTVRVENPLDPGMPDVNYCWFDLILGQQEGWIELKIAKPKPMRNPLVRLVKPIRPAQLVWLEVRSLIKGNVHVLVETPEWPTQYLLLPGRLAGALLKDPLPWESFELHACPLSSLKFLKKSLHEAKSTLNLNNQIGG